MDVNKFEDLILDFVDRELKEKEDQKNNPNLFNNQG